MAFRAYLVSKFTNSHENQMFGVLYESLERALKGSDEAHYLIGNCTIDNMEFDALFLKHDAITVIEMKDYDGTIHFSENGDWTADKLVVKGGSWGNPFRQVRTYKFKLLEYLKRNGSSIYNSDRREKFFRPSQILGVVLFGGCIEFDEELPKSIRSWFAICDHTDVAPRLLRMSNKNPTLEGVELQRVLRLLGLGPRQLYHSASDRNDQSPPKRGIQSTVVGAGVRTGTAKKSGEHSTGHGAKSEQNRRTSRPSRPKQGIKQRPEQADVKSWFKQEEIRLLSNYFELIASQRDGLAKLKVQDWKRPERLAKIDTDALTRLDVSLQKVVSAGIIQKLRDKGVVR